MTPLSQACTNGNDAFVRALLKSGANANTAIATGVTPLMTCARSGSVDAVRRLVEFGAAIEAKEPAQGQTALMWAAAEHHIDVVKALIEAHADLKAHSKQGFTAMHFAARQGDREMVELLLAAGVDLNILSQPDEAPAAPGGPGSARTTYRKTAGTAGYTPLLVATVRGQVPLALYLLERGARPEHSRMPRLYATPALGGDPGDGRSFTANRVYGLEDAMMGIPDRQAKLRLIDALLAHGANPNARMTKTQPSIAGGYEDTVGATPFLLASSNDDLEVMRILIKAGADPKIATATNATALMAATGVESWDWRGVR